MPATTREQDDFVEEYARLNRMVERGDASRATKRHLIEVCIKLDKRDEAIAAFQGIEDPAFRHAIRPELARLGWVTADYDPEELQAVTVTDATLNPSLREKLEDAVQFLCEGQMRTHVLGGTLAFPILLGAGGVLASSTGLSFLWLVAVLPALLAVGMVGALGRHVLTMTIEGRDDSTDLPDRSQLLRESWRILVDFGALSAVFLGPAAALLWLGAPMIGLVFLLVAGLFMPLTTALRLTGTEWRNLTPRRVVTAVWRLIPAYPIVAGTVALLMAPAVFVLIVTAGMHILVMVSVSGPLAVVPALVSARILGLTLHFERDRLSGLFTLPACVDRRR